MTTKEKAEAAIKYIENKTIQGGLSLDFKEIAAAYLGSLAKVERLREILREVEWSAKATEDDEGYPICPVCSAYEDVGNHMSDCRLKAALADAVASSAAQVPDKADKSAAVPE